MDTDAEAYMAYRSALNEVRIRLFPFLGITVRSAEKEQYLTVAIEMHAAELGIASDRPEKRLYRRFNADSLLEGWSGESGRISAKHFPLIGGACEAINRCANPINR